MPANERLSAPEAFVLMSLPKYDVNKTLKLGFMGLLAQGLLRIEQEDRPGLIRTRHIPHLLVTPAAQGRTLSPIAASLISVVHAAEPRGLMRQVVKQSTRAYGATLVGFAMKLVLPSLIERGLAVERKSRLLGLLPWTRYFRTAAGENERVRLEGLIRQAVSIPDFLDRDPAQAAALIAALGGAIILVESLRPHYQAIASAMRPYTGDTVLSDFTNVGDSGGIDFGALGGIDLGAFDSGAFDSLAVTAAAAAAEECRSPPVAQHRLEYRRGDQGPLIAAAVQPGQGGDQLVLQRDGLLVFAILPEQRGEVADRDQGVGIVFAENPDERGNRLFEHGPRREGVAHRGDGAREIVDRPQRVARFIAIERAQAADDLLLQKARPREVALLTGRHRELAERLQRIGMPLAVELPPSGDHRFFQLARP
jgi:hypothetical protein